MGTEDTNAISVVLDNCQYPGNIGAAARAMKTMGFSSLRLVKPERFPDKEAIYRAASARDVVERAELYQDLPAALADCDLVVATSARRRTRSLPLLELRAFAEQLPEMNYRKLALVFGREDRGLDEQAILQAHYQVFVPCSAAYPVLNLAMCVQLCCYEISLALPQKDKRSDAADHYAIEYRQEHDHASGAELESFYQHLERIALSSGFLNPERPMHLSAKLRRLFQRARLGHNEVQILRGLLSACERKMGGG